MISTLASQRLLEGRWPEDVQIAVEGESVRLLLDRGSLHVLVTVPLSVREWFVDVLGPTSDVYVRDWCDYDGYDDTSEAQRNQDMADDVEAFVANLLSHELRMGRDNKTLEWKVGELWVIAVPLQPESLRVSTDRISHQTLR